MPKKKKPLPHWNENSRFVKLEEPELKKAALAVAEQELCEGFNINVIGEKTLPELLSNAVGLYFWDLDNLKMPRKKEIMAALERMQNAINEYIDAVQTFDDPILKQVLFEDDYSKKLLYQNPDLMRKAVDYAEILRELSFIAICQLSPDSGGPKRKYPGLFSLICSLADIYETATGKKATASYTQHLEKIVHGEVILNELVSLYLEDEVFDRDEGDGVDGIYDSDFVRLVYKILEAIGQHELLKISLGTYINTILKKRIFQEKNRKQ